MNYNNYDTGYSTTSYGAQGGAGGGGFMAEGSQTSPSGNRGYGNDTLRPVTIKQLHDATQENTDAEFVIDGTPISQVTFVAQIRSITKQTTNVLYRMDDGTGVFEVKQWIDSDAAMNGDVEGGDSKLQDNQYARVWGKLKAFNGKKHLGAHAIRPISDYNEISYHLLEATTVHLFFTRGPPGQAKGGAQNGANGDHSTGYDGGANGGSSLGAGTSQTARRVYECIRTSPQSNEGLHMSDIAGRLSMQTGDVLRAGDELLSMGVIYTTVDDHTWAILNM